MNSPKNITAAVLLALGTLATGAAQAAITSWNLGSGGSTCTPNPVGASTATPLVCTSGSASVTISSWSNTSGTGLATQVGSGVNAGNIAGNSQTLEGGKIERWAGGLGIYNNDGNSAGADQDVSENGTPGNSVDNNQRIDSLLFDFSASGLFNLSSLGVGDVSGDSDMTVMAYTGATPFNTASNLAGKTYAQLLTSGWSLVNNVANVSTSGTAISTATKSSYWLIGAYNNLVGGTALSAGNDNVKVNLVAGTVTRVPEPASALLVGLGLGAIGVVRRKRQAAALAA